MKLQFDTLNGLAALPRVPATQLTKENCSTLLVWNVLFCKKLFSPLRFWMKTPFSPDSLPQFFTVELRILRSMTFRPLMPFWFEPSIVTLSSVAPLTLLRWTAALQAALPFDGPVMPQFAVVGSPFVCAVFVRLRFLIVSVGFVAAAPRTSIPRPLTF